MTKREVIAELVVQGLSNKEIADKTGINYNTVYSYAKDIRKLAAVGDIGKNADRHLCRRCRFRNKHYGICDYISYMHKSRGCKVADCDKYERGKKGNRK